ncbi:hypothetical protein CDAR_472901 [Caerostris darwini]|uniref:Uncharacterized protein n=1 Tax=Caerostris darwini TaxID=1538125 RepID=A0AAV4V918_9ARAC|nr:hypothetical protein CDAR_472901 [Caerostris darwini]
MIIVLTLIKKKENLHNSSFKNIKKKSSKLLKVSENFSKVFENCNSALVREKSARSLDRDTNWRTKKKIDLTIISVFQHHILNLPDIIKGNERACSSLGCIFCSGAGAGGDLRMIHPDLKSGCLHLYRFREKGHLIL